MPKLPRDVPAKRLISLLEQHGYRVTRQVGSHIRLTRGSHGDQLSITIPNHNPIKIGTLNAILRELSLQLGLDRDTLVTQLRQQ